MLRVVSMEDSSEFMMISIESFNKLTQVCDAMHFIYSYLLLCNLCLFVEWLHEQKFHDEERDEKLRAIQSCSSYSSRPRHLIQQLMAVFEWREFAPNTSEHFHRLSAIFFTNPVLLVHVHVYMQFWQAKATSVRSSASSTEASATSCAKWTCLTWTSRRAKRRRRCDKWSSERWRPKSRSARWAPYSKSPWAVRSSPRHTAVSESFLAISFLVRTYTQKCSQKCLFINL